MQIAKSDKVNHSGRHRGRNSPVSESRDSAVTMAAEPQETYAYTFEVQFEFFLKERKAQGQLTEFHRVQKSGLSLNNA
jgi:hypothetical protein